MFSLRQHFSDELADRRLIHPLGAVDEGVTIFIRPIGTAVAARIPRFGLDAGAEAGR